MSRKSESVVSIKDCPVIDSEQAGLHFIKQLLNDLKVLGNEQLAVAIF